MQAIRAAGGRADFVAADLAGGADAARVLAADATRLLGGRVDVLVNNAGIFPATSTEGVDPETFDAVVAVNVAAPFFLTQAIAPAMAARGGGAIVSLGSWIAQVGLEGGALYAASKAMVEQLTRNWAAEYGRAGVRVNAIAPGITLTDGTAPMEATIAEMARAFPAGRLGTPEEIAAAAVFLAGDEASFVHGATLLVDGGALSTRMRTLAKEPGEPVAAAA